MERPEPTAPFLARVERVLLWLLLPAFVACLVLTLRLSAKVDTLEQALADAPAATVADRASVGDGERRGGTGAKLQVSGKEREEIVRKRLDSFVAESQIDEETAGRLREALEELLAEATRLREARRSGQIPNRQGRKDLQEARDAMIEGSRALLGDETAEELRSVLFPPHGSGNEPYEVKAEMPEAPSEVPDDGSEGPGRAGEAPEGGNEAPQTEND